MMEEDTCLVNEKQQKLTEISSEAKDLHAIVGGKKNRVEKFQKALEDSAESPAASCSIQSPLSGATGDLTAYPMLLHRDLLLHGSN
jgi:hypothetical protein